MGAFGATLPARYARYGKLVDAFGATLPARCARYGGLVNAFGATLPARYGGLVAALDPVRRVGDPRSHAPGRSRERTAVSDMDLRSVLIEIHTALDAAGIGHARIGGLALSVHGAGRATIDLGDPDMERVRSYFQLFEQLRQVFGDPLVDRTPSIGDDFRI